MVVDWDEAEALEDEDGEDEPESLKRRLFKRFSKFLPIKT
jgi:hypothetical protein